LCIILGFSGAVGWMDLGWRPPWVALVILFAPLLACSVAAWVEDRRDRRRWPRPAPAGAQRPLSELPHFPSIRASG
jgi:hypothetical protein